MRQTKYGHSPMLQTLRIKNLALVENITVDFAPGLNMITGETGAGKSVLIGALGLLLGDRADKTLIRTGEDQCGVEALFVLAKPAQVDPILLSHGLDPCEGGQLIVRRIITASGTSRNFVNGSPATVQVLKQIGDLLVDMHGPHDHQSLLSPSFQLDLLDAFGGLTEARATYAEQYSEWRDLLTRRQALDGDGNEVTRQIDLLRFQVQELEAAALKNGEDDDVAREHALVANAQRILEVSDTIRNALMEDEASAFGRLASVHKGLQEIQALLPAAVAWREQAESISIALRELSADITREVERIEGDSARLQWLEDRLALYQKLKRKYHATVSGLLAMLVESKNKLHDLENHDAQIAELGLRLMDMRKRLEQTGKQLGRDRATSAERLAQRITRELRDLGFLHGVFTAILGDAEPGPTGMNSVEFTFAPNVGETARPLRAIASSGEISRVMLAVKAVLAHQDRIPILIFDEIDENIGGEMGHAIGLKLSTVARHHQVICITHLPQVAVHATHHLAVRKEVAQGRTRTQIQPLDAEARVSEIARMLGAKDSSGVVRQHARELLQCRGAS